MSLYLDGIQVETKDAPKYKYSAKDFDDPSKLRGGRTTKIKIPATQVAKKLLGGKGLEEELKTPEARFGNGTVAELSGKCIPQRWGDDYIEAFIASDSAQWFDVAKNLKIQDLNLGTYEFNKTNVQNSWTSGNAVVYPLIDYGGLEDALGGNTKDVTIANFRPGVYVKNLLQQGFKRMGFSLSIDGRLDNKLKRCFLPNTEEYSPTEDYLETQSADWQYSGSAVALTVDDFAGSLPAPFYSFSNCMVGAATKTDPGGNTSGSSFVPTLDMKARVSVNLNITPSGASPLFTIKHYIALIHASADATAGDAIMNAIEIVANTANPFNSGSRLDLGEHDFTAGESYHVAILTRNPHTSYTTSSLNVYFDATDFVWQSGISYDLASTLPDWNFMKLLKNVCNNLGAIPVTSGKSVTLKYLDDYFVSYSPRNWSGRQLSEYKKIQPEIPRQVEFKFTIDDGDAKQLEWETANSTPFGSYTVDMANGFADNKEIELDFAATFSDTILGDAVTVPVLRKDGQYQLNTYNHEPRMLLWDGLRTGTFLFDGTRLDEYPFAYFDRADRRYSLAFKGVNDNNTSLDTGQVRGEIGCYKEWRAWVQRWDTKQIVELYIRLYNEDLKELGQAIELDLDGFPHQFFIHNIKNKSMDNDRALVQLIQV